MKESPWETTHRQISKVLQNTLLIQKVRRKTKRTSIINGTEIFKRIKNLLEIFQQRRTKQSIQFTNSYNNKLQVIQFITLTSKRVGPLQEKPTETGKHHQTRLKRHLDNVCTVGPRRKRSQPQLLTWTLEFIGYKGPKVCQGTTVTTRSKNGRYHTPHTTLVQDWDSHKHTH